ncbi:hypothetical protein BO71DRAFT_329361, partial [Aspergillus ellipticus CBS 707.79]
IKNLLLYQSVLKHLYNISILYSNTNRYNFIIYNNIVYLIDFENSKLYNIASTSIQAEIESLRD